MPVIINPNGRYVVIDDQKDFELWLATPGFKKPIPQEEKETGGLEGVEEVKRRDRPPGDPIGY